MFSTTRVVGFQPYALAAFTPGEIPGTHFQRLSRSQGTWFRRWEPRTKSPVTLPEIDPWTVRLVALPQVLKSILCSAIPCGSVSAILFYVTCTGSHQILRGFCPFS